MMKPKKIPMRMCLGCNEMKPKKELMRVVKSPEGEISLDFVGKKNDPPLPEHELDVEATLNKYLMEEKTETFFD